MSLLVSEEQVVHDGAIVEVLQRGHVLYAPDAAEAHGLHLLPRQRVLLVRVHLQQETRGRDGNSSDVRGGYNPSLELGKLPHSVSISGGVRGEAAVQYAIIPERWRSQAACRP